MKAAVYAKSTLDDQNRVNQQNHANALLKQLSTALQGHATVKPIEEEELPAEVAATFKQGLEDFDVSKKTSKEGAEDQSSAKPAIEISLTDQKKAGSKLNAIFEVHFKEGPRVFLGISNDNSQFLGCGGEFNEKAIDAMAETSKAAGWKMCVFQEPVPEAISDELRSYAFNKFKEAGIIIVNYQAKFDKAAEIAGETTLAIEVSQSNPATSDATTSKDAEAKLATSKTAAAEIKVAVAAAAAEIEIAATAAKTAAPTPFSTSPSPSK